jgi:hypothetical protein
VLQTPKTVVLAAIQEREVAKFFIEHARLSSATGPLSPTLLPFAGDFALRESGRTFIRPEPLPRMVMSRYGLDFYPFGQRQAVFEIGSELPDGVFKRRSMLTALNCLMMGRAIPLTMPASLFIVGRSAPLIRRWRARDRLPQPLHTDGLLEARGRVRMERDLREHALAGAVGSTNLN